MILVCNIESTTSQGVTSGKYIRWLGWSCCKGRSVLMLIHIMSVKFNLACHKRRLVSSLLHFECLETPFVGKSGTFLFQPLPTLPVLPGWSSLEVKQAGCFYQYSCTPFFWERRNIHYMLNVLQITDKHLQTTWTNWHIPLSYNAIFVI